MEKTTNERTNGNLCRDGRVQAVDATNNVDVSKRQWQGNSLRPSSIVPVLHVAAGTAEEKTRNDKMVRDNT